MRFFPKLPVVAFISDSSIDFAPANFDSPLDIFQQSYLEEHTEQNIHQVFWRKQVHGDTIHIAKGRPSSCSQFSDADAFITNVRRLPIAIRTADCVPVFVVDPIKKVIGLAHAGWKGTQLQIAAKTVSLMQEKFGCEWYDIWVELGPAIRPCCYMVGNEFKNYFPQDVRDHEDGSIRFDIIEANRRQLLALGLNPAQVIDSMECTCCDSNYFSFRRDKDKAGRMISVMMLL